MASQLAHQDWKVQVVRTANKGKAAGGSPAAGQSARKVSAHAAKMMKLENANGDEGRPAISLSTAQTIRQGRTARGMTQKQLAQAINEKPANIVAYEAGTMIVPNASAGKIERALGVKLRGRKKKSSKKT